jgi:dTDP-4-amino-4,6-dideoxygalactose transaminase
LTQANDLVPLMQLRLPGAAALQPYLEEIDRNRWYTNFGPLERRLTGAMERHFNLPAGGVTSAANATIGLALALMAVTEGSPGVCLMPGFTFVATAHAARTAGLTPCFADVSEAEWMLTPAIAHAALDQIDGPVVAVMPVGVFGAPVDTAAWDDFQRETGIPVVIDAAAGIDGACIGRCPTVISLHATKPLAAGEGALVVSRDPDIVGEIMTRANFGFRGARRADTAGMNGKLSEYAAAVALASFDLWPETRGMLAEVTECYRAGLAGLAGVRLSPGYGEGWVSSTCNIALAEPAADCVIDALGARAIEARQWWSKGCHREPAFSDCPRTGQAVVDSLADRVVGLPYFAGLRPEAIDRIVGALGGILAR